MIQRISKTKLSHGAALAFLFVGVLLMATMGSPGVSHAGLYTIDSCVDCHTSPPTDATGGVRNTPEGAVAGSHSKHSSLACSTCHVQPSENDFGHSDGNIDMAAIYGDGAYTWPAPSDPNRVVGGVLKQTSTVTPADLGTCSNFYCHSSGTSNTPPFSAAGSWPKWGNTAACGTCHASQPTTGSHSVHISASSTCGDCHSGAGDGSAVPSSNHVNRNVDVTGGYTAGGTPGNASNGTCSTASCHNDGNGLVSSPQWGTTITDCSECHATQPTTGSHGPHLADNNDCGKCHSDAVRATTAPTGIHRNSVKDVYDVTPGDLGWNSGAKTCSTASCHMTTTAAWGTSITDCSECHAKRPTTAAHTVHIVTEGAACDACHVGAVEGTTAPTSGHRDGATTATVGGYNDSTQVCATATCHNDGNGQVASPAWTTTITDCSECHATQPTTGSHGPHLADNNDCGKCHSDAVRATTAPTGIHRNSVKDVYDVTPGDLGWNSGAKTCSTASCHMTTTAAWGTSITDCSECHAKRPSTGSHTIHVVTEGAACGTCHVGAVEGTTAPTSGHRNGVTAADGNCSTSLCHFDGYAAYTPPAWGSSISNCSECHANQPTYDGHAKHNTTTIVTALNRAECGDCHDGAVQGTTAPTIGHRDGNPSASTTLNGYTDGNRNGTCSAAYCHSDGLGNYTTVAWNATSTGCNFCHGAPPVNGVHPGNAEQCDDCHTQVNHTSDGFLSVSTHINGTVEAPSTNCNSCHSYTATDWASAGNMLIEGKGAHEKHIVELASRNNIALPLNATTGKNDGYGAGQNALICGTCHTNLEANHRNVTPVARVINFGDNAANSDYKFSPSANPTYNGVPGVGSATTPKTCSNISCHYVETPLWSNPNP